MYGVLGKPEVRGEASSSRTILRLCPHPLGVGLVDHPVSSVDSPRCKEGLHSQVSKVAQGHHG